MNCNVHMVYCKAFVEGEMAIEEHEMQNKLMTKAEATKICHDNGWGNLTLVLEALGLIEFKEEEKELSTKITEAGEFVIREEIVIKVMNSIALAGYKIVPK